jgi:streptogramin lyase
VTKIKKLISCTGLGCALTGLIPAGAQAQSASALTGQVTSAEEGPMGGVLVSVKKDGSTITVSVVSDPKGEYSFPADRLDAGHYTIAIPAAGYNLDDSPKAVDIASGGAKADIKLVKTKNLVNQLTNAEWLLSAPGPENVRTQLINETQPHDVIVDQDGMVWYSDFSNQFAGVMDPGTGKATEIPIPVLKPEQPKGSLDIELDPGQKNVWLSLMYQAGVARIDRATHQVTMYPFPEEWQSASTQASMVSPQHADIDGKVLTNNQEMHGVYRLDVKSGQFEDLGQSKDLSGRQISAYGMPTDQQNNVYQLEFGGTSIGYRDLKAGTTTIYRTPMAGSKPRRGRVDEQNRLWFAEYGGNAIGLFDPKTAAIKEYPLPTKFSEPYDVVPTKDASQVWTGSMVNDRVARLDTKSGQITEYLMPRPTNIRRVFLQETGPRPTLWVGSNHGASIVKVEPLD